MGRLVKLERPWYCKDRLYPAGIVELDSTLPADIKLPKGAVVMDEAELAEIPVSAPTPVALSQLAKTLQPTGLEKAAVDKAK